MSSRKQNKSLSVCFLSLVLGVGLVACNSSTDSNRSGPNDSSGPASNQQNNHSDTRGNDNKDHQNDQKSDEKTPPKIPDLNYNWQDSYYLYNAFLVKNSHSPLGATSSSVVYNSKGSKILSQKNWITSACGSSQHFAYFSEGDLFVVDSMGKKVLGPIPAKSSLPLGLSGTCAIHNNFLFYVNLAGMLIANSLEDPSIKTNLVLKDAHQCRFSNQFVACHQDSGVTVYRNTGKKIERIYLSPYIDETKVKDVSFNIEVSDKIVAYVVEGKKNDWFGAELNRVVAVDFNGKEIDAFGADFTYGVGHTKIRRLFAHDDVVSYVAQDTYSKVYSLTTVDEFGKKSSANLTADPYLFGYIHSSPQIIALTTGEFGIQKNVEVYDRSMNFLFKVLVEDESVSRNFWAFDNAFAYLDENKSLQVKDLKGNSIFKSNTLRKTKEFVIQTSPSFLALQEKQSEKFQVIDNAGKQILALTDIIFDDDKNKRGAFKTNSEFITYADSKNNLIVKDAKGNDLVMFPAPELKAE